LTIAHRPAGIADELTPLLLVCLLWKESGFDPLATNPNSTARGIAQILDGTADDIQDRIAKRWGGKDPFYLLEPGQRLKDHRTEPGISVYAAYLYLQDSIQVTRTLLGALQRYGPKAQAVADCANELGKCALQGGDAERGWFVADEKEAWRILHKIHR
jgi:hypothetical protein